jgi:hypothetical protein
LAVESRGIPHLAKNERDAPNFLHAALDKSACAPFFEERRMRRREPTKLHRKSGMWGYAAVFVILGSLWSRASDYLDKVVKTEMAGEGCLDLAGVEFVVLFRCHDGLVQWQTDDGPAEQTLRYSLFA